MSIYCFDLDNTLCHTTGRDYENAQPIHSRICKLNKLYDSGHRILIYTARGMGYFSGDLEKIEGAYRELTESRLSEWGVRYHELKFGKPSYDFIIDDKNILLADFDKEVKTRGLIAGAFDVIHPGYISLFIDCKTHCDELIVALHDDPSKERPSKIPPVLDVENRYDILESIKHIDRVLIYQTEEDLARIMDDLDIDIRFLGSDYRNKSYTEGEKKIPVIYLERDHGWSTTKMKNIIYNQIKEKNNG